MAKVYLVSRGGYSDYEVVAIFDEDHKDIAQRFSETIRDRNDLEEFELNPEVNIPKKKMR